MRDPSDSAITASAMPTAHCASDSACEKTLPFSIHDSLWEFHPACTTSRVEPAVLGEDLPGTLGICRVLSRRWSRVRE